MRTSATLIVAFFLLSIPPAAHGGEHKPTWKPLWPDGAPGAKGKEEEDIPAVLVYLPAVLVYLPPANKANGAAVVICPGGGYRGLALDHEGHQIARWLNNHGIAGIILRYRLGPKYNHPMPLRDAQRAIRLTRSHAKEWRLDPAKIGILGFSAGGHLASTAGTHFDRGDAAAKDPIDRLSSRPDFMVLLYPVITLSGPFAHVGSRTHLLGKDPDPAVVESLCNDRQVTRDTPPTFLVHTSEDKGVKPENSVLFYLALAKHEVPAEMHIYEKGEHGLGLGRPGSPFSTWPDRCIAWLQGRGLLRAKE